MHYIKLIWTFFRIGVLNEMAYRVNFYVQLLQSVLNLGTAIAGLAIVFAHTDTLGGWQAVDILALLGVFMFVGGVIRLVIHPSMSQFMEDVRLGTFDYTLTKPCDAQFLASISQIRLWRIADVLLGSGVLIAALIYKGIGIGPREALAFAFALCTGGAIIYSFWLILATLTFWFLRIENILVIFQSMYEAGRWPIGIYPHWLRYIRGSFSNTEKTQLLLAAQGVVKNGGSLMSRTWISCIAVPLVLVVTLTALIIRE